MKIELLKSNVSSFASLLPKQLITTSVFWWFLPISIILPISFGQINVTSFRNISLWLLIGTTAHFAMFPFMIYGRAGKNLVEQIILILMMGVVRGSLISLLPPIFRLTDELSLVTRITNSTVSVFYWNLVGSILIQYGSAFRNQVKEILNEILEKQIVGLPAAAKSSSNELTKIIGYLQEKIIKTVGASPSKEEILMASREIDTLIADHIKPLSKSRWRDGQLTWVRAGFIALIKSALDSTKIPVLGVIITALPFAIITQISRVGVIGTILVQSFWVLITLTINWLVFQSKPSGKYFKYNLRFLLGVIFISYPTTFIFQSNISIANPDSLQTKFQGYFVSMVVEISLFLLGAILITLHKEQEFAFEFLKGVINRGQLESLLTKTRTGNSDAQFAQYLHAEVQSQLLACKLLLLKAAESNFELFPPEITQQIIERMEKISAPYEAPATRIPSQRIKELSISWSGLAKINYDLPSELEVLNQYSDVTSQLIEEAVVNSIRHGKASEIWISARLHNQNLEVKIIDNGQLGSAKSSRGLGSILFDTFTKSWSLDHKNEQTVLIFSIDTTLKGSLL